MTDVVQMTMTPREQELRRHHDNTPHVERVKCDTCFLLMLLAETREVVRACEARMAPGWKPVVDIVGSSPQYDEAPPRQMFTGDGDED